MNEREYDRINNEGGEGYNPIRAKRESEEHAQLTAKAREHASTPAGRIEALQRRIHLECGSVARECGDNDQINALQSDLYSQIRSIEAEINAEFLSVWTPEETTRRRDGWNARVKAGEFRDERKAYRAMKEQGWGLNDLKKAVNLNNL